MTPLTHRFESIEEAQEYVRLLREVVAETQSLIGQDIAELNGEIGRQGDALKLVDYKLRQLSEHLRSSSRLLNDLRTLRRILYGEREEPATEADTSLASDQLGI
jgi:hypothetical protein